MTTGEGRSVAASRGWTVTDVGFSRFPRSIEQVGRAFDFQDLARQQAGHRPEAGVAGFVQPADDLGGHVRLSQSTTIPVGVGESLYSHLHFREYLQQGACSIVQVDAARVGGITPWLKVAHLAECFNVPVCPHFLMELHVSLCSAVPNGRWVEYIPQLDTLTASPMRIEAGHAIPSNAPGLGIDWDWAAIKAQTVPGSASTIT